MKKNGNDQIEKTGNILQNSKGNSFKNLINFSGKSLGIHYAMKGQSKQKKIRRTCVIRMTLFYVLQVKI